MRKRVLMPQEEKELHKLCKDIEKNYKINTSCEQTQDTEEKRQKAAEGVVVGRCKEKIKPKNNKELTCFLEIWLTEKAEQQLALTILKKEKKATWFRELETKIISEPLARKIRQELMKVEKNLYVAKIPIQPVSNDKKKKEWILFKKSGKTKVGRISKKRVKNKIKIEHWNRDDDKENSIQEGPKLKRCQGCNDEQKKQSRGCLLQRNFKSNKKAIIKKLIGKSNEKKERELLVPIKLFNFKPSINKVTTEQLKKEPAVSYLVIEPLKERILKECIKGKE
ncbi:16664_t:CDS:2, partial [Gigaspora margarita]